MHVFPTYIWLEKKHKLFEQLSCNGFGFGFGQAKSSRLQPNKRCAAASERVSERLASTEFASAPSLQILPRKAKAAPPVRSSARLTSIRSHFNTPRPREPVLFHWQTEPSGRTRVRPRESKDIFLRNGDHGTRRDRLINSRRTASQRAFGFWFLSSFSSPSCFFF